MTNMDIIEFLRTRARKIDIVADRLRGRAGDAFTREHELRKLSASYRGMADTIVILTDTDRRLSDG